MSETKESKWSYVAAIALPILGGILAYFVIGKHDTKMSRNCLLISLAWVVIIAVGIIANPSHPSTESTPINTSSSHPALPTTNYEGLTPFQVDFLEQMQTDCSSSDYPSPEDQQRCQNLVDIAYKDFQILNNHTLPTEEQAIKLVQNYKGKDGKGLTILEAISSFIVITYPNEDITSNPSTSIKWYVDKEAGTYVHPIYQVLFQFTTYRGDTDFIFYLDPFNNTVWAGNTIATDILQIVDDQGT